MSILSGTGIPSNKLYNQIQNFKLFAMKALKIKYLKGAFTVFALCLIGTVSAAPNGNGEEKEKEKVSSTIKSVATQWFNAAEVGSDIYITDAISSPTSPCTQSSGPLCAVQLDLTNVDPNDLEELYEKMEDPEQDSPTLQDFIAANATQGPTSHRN